MPFDSINWQGLYIPEGLFSPCHLMHLPVEVHFAYMEGAQTHASVHTRCYQLSPTIEMSLKRIQFVFHTSKSYIPVPSASLTHKINFCYACHVISNKPKKDAIKIFASNH